MTSRLLVRKTRPAIALIGLGGVFRLIGSFDWRGFSVIWMGNIIIELTGVTAVVLSGIP